MKILAIHADFIEFEAKKKAFKGAEEGIKEGKHRVDECLVVLSSVEKRDEANVKGVIYRYVDEIKNIAGQVKVTSIVLYPYAHLSSQLAAPVIAEEVLKQAESLLQAQNFTVTRAPFGWYKSFTLSCKGHPLSELSREFTADGKEPIKSKKGSSQGEIVIDPKEIEVLVKKLSKNNVSAARGKNGLKSNVEIGKELDIYIVNEVVGQGLPLMTPKGATIKREIERFAIDEELKRGYLHTSTPVMAKSDLYKVSGHWQHYQDSMFTMPCGDETLALRPMTCPFHFILFKSKTRSYKDLPMKYAEMATLFRNEQSGELRGLTRVRQFTLADAHIVCRKDQVPQQFEEVVELLKYVMKTLGVKDIWYRFSKWDPQDKKKYIDNPRMWEEAQTMMKTILDKLKINYKEAEGEAAFYGPKLDLQYTDVYGKEDTLLTVQIDFALPDRYDLTYIDENGAEVRPVIIHRSSTGATERLMAYLLEKTRGALPVWLSPVQVKVMTMTDRNIPFAQKVYEKLRQHDVRVELDIRSESIGKKVRDAQVEKVNYMITVGDKEEEKKTLAVRTREGDVKFDVPVQKFVEQIVREIRERRL